MFDWIERNSSPDAVLTGNLDPVLYLYTGRKSVRGFVQNPYLLHYSTDEHAQPLGSPSELLDTIRWVRGELPSLRTQCLISPGALSDTTDRGITA